MVYTENDTSMAEEYGTTGFQQIVYSKLTLEGFYHLLVNVIQEN